MAFFRGVIRVFERIGEFIADHWTIFAVVFGGIALFIVIGFIAALPTMWLWNWLMPSIFNLRRINFFESWGLLVLSSLLIKSGASTSVSKK